LLKTDIDRKISDEESNMKRMVEQERILLKNKEELKQKREERNRQETVVKQKLESVHLAKSCVLALRQNVLEKLEKRDFFADQIRQRVLDFIPNIMNQTNQNIQQISTAQSLVLDLMSSSLASVEQGKQQAEAKRKLELERRKLEDLERKKHEDELKRRRMIIQLYLHSEAVSESPVGPIDLSGESTVKQVEDKVMKWMEQNLEKHPTREQLKFTWNGKQLDQYTTLYDLGIENLSTIQMKVEKTEEEKQRELMERMEHERKQLEEISQIQHKNETIKEVDEEQHQED